MPKKITIQGRENIVQIPGEKQCYRCGESGHLGRECPEVECYVCRGRGHQGNQCKLCKICGGEHRFTDCEDFKPKMYLEKLRQEYLDGNEEAWKEYQNQQKERQREKEKRVKEYLKNKGMTVLERKEKSSEVSKCQERKESSEPSNKRELKDEQQGKLKEEVQRLREEAKINVEKMVNAIIFFSISSKVEEEPKPQRRGKKQNKRQRQEEAKQDGTEEEQITKQKAMTEGGSVRSQERRAKQLRQEILDRRAKEMGITFNMDMLDTSGSQRESSDSSDAESSVKSLPSKLGGGKKRQ